MKGEFFRWLRLRWRGLFRRHSHEADLNREMQFHVEMLVAENLAAGMTPSEARQAASREFGGAAQYREECRDSWRPAIVCGLSADLAYAARSLRRSPGFTAVAVFTLSLGIGVNAVVFSFVRGMILGPKARDDALHLTALFNGRVGPEASFRPFSYPEFIALRQADEVFTDVAAMSLYPAAIGQGQELQRRFLSFVSENYFSALAAQPAQGRFFNAEESRPGAALPVVVASHALWERLGRRPDFVGSTLRIDDRTYSVVGIAPAGFVGLDVSVGPDAWLPLGEFAPLAGVDLQRSAETRFSLFARLRPELTLATARTRLNSVNARLNALAPADKGGPRQVVLGLPPRSDIAYVRPEDEPPLVAFGGIAMGLALMVLLVACLNLANLLLARGASRHKEIAIRLAIGASRWRVVRGLLAEGLLLALLGGALSLALVQWSGALLTQWAVEAFVTGKFSVRVAPFIDGRLIAVTLGLSLLATLAFSLWPALRMTRPNLFPDLKQVSDSPPSMGRRHRWLGLRELPLLTQIALSLALLFSAALFVQGARNARTLDLGFEPRNQVVTELDYQLAKLDAMAIPRRQQALLESASALPGVTSAALASAIPYNFDQPYRPVRLAVGGTPAIVDPKQPRAWAAYTAVTRGYFKTTGAQILRGRDFSPEESQGTTGRGVTVIDDTLARALFGEADAIGRTVYDSDRADATPVEVIGLVRSPKDDPFGRAPRRLYRPLGQSPESRVYLQAQVREPLPFVATLRNFLRTSAPEMPSLPVRLFADLVDQNINVLLVRLAGMLFGLFGVIAVILAAVGVYGVKAHAMIRRTREIGIRMALGARPSDVMALLFKQGALQALVGIAAGLALALAAGRGLSAMLYKVSPFDLTALAGSAGLLAGAILLACWLPARRAAKIDPLTAIRTE